MPLDVKLGVKAVIDSISLSLSLSVSYSLSLYICLCAYSYSYRLNSYRLFFQIYKLTEPEIATSSLVDAIVGRIASKDFVTF